MNSDFSKRLRELRGDKSQEEFSTIIGVKQTSYSSWERGEKDPSISVLAKISSTMGVSSDWLLGLSEDRGGSQSAAPTPALTKSRQKVFDPSALLSDELAAIRRELHRQAGELAALKQLNHPSAACCG